MMQDLGALIPEENSWPAKRSLATAIRTLIFVVPVGLSAVILILVGDMLYQPSGTIGFGVWAVQAAPIGATIAVVASRYTRQALPLAALLELALTFPEEAPSRVSMGLRARTAGGLREILSDVRTNGLGESEIEATTRAVELILLLDVHYRSTRGRSARVMTCADLVAREIGMPESDRVRLSWGVLLHDIGMLAIPSDILVKKGKLTESEREVLKNHPLAGNKMLTPLTAWLGDWMSAVGQHHERWDGGGYPLGLAGASISVPGRITAIADTYEAITAKRSYRKSMSIAEARNELKACAGTQFDPEIVHAFLSSTDKKKIAFGQIGRAGASALQTSKIALVGAAVAVAGIATLSPLEPTEPLPFIASTTTTAAAQTTSPPVPEPTMLATTATDATASVSASSTTRSTRPQPTTSTTAATTSTTRAPATNPPATNPPTTTPPATQGTTTVAPTTTTEPPPPTIVSS